MMQQWLLLVYTWAAETVSQPESAVVESSYYSNRVISFEFTSSSGFKQ